MQPLETTYQYTQAFCCAGVVLEKDGKILMIRENRPGHADHGMWNFPCGWLDLGEDPYETAIRETREEAGYDVKPHALLGIYSSVRNDLQKGNAMPHGINIFYVGTPLNEEPYTHDYEVSEIQWITPNDFLALPDNSLRGSKRLKSITKDYMEGKRYPLELIQHAIQKIED